MQTKDQAISLYLLQLEKNGLSKSDFDELTDLQKLMVEKKEDKYYIKEEYRRLFTVCLTGGVFDIIHPGHIYTLNEAKKYADILIVVIATDETVQREKGRRALHNQIERMQLVNSLKPVSLALIGGSNYKDTLMKISPDIVIFGYDQKKKQTDEIKTIQLDKFIDSKNSDTSAIRDKLGI